MGAVKALLTTGVVYLRSLVAGIGSAVYTPSGVITASTTQAATIADTNETDLWTYTLPANSLNANLKGVRIHVFGTFGATANNKTIKLYFAGTQIGALTSAGNNVAWEMLGTVLRTGASSQLAGGAINVDLSSQRAVVTTPAGDTTTGLIIKMTGQNGTAAANDIVFRGAIVEYLS
jgi:hypothetical protein